MGLYALVPRKARWAVVLRKASMAIWIEERTMQAFQADVRGRWEEVRMEGSEGSGMNSQSKRKRVSGVETCHRGTRDHHGPQAMRTGQKNKNDTKSECGRDH
jgi:hypothetical protein